jgi:hypothetical protein
VGLSIPGELSSLLSTLGYTWPQADEEKLFELGRMWSGFGGEISDIVQDASTAAQRVWNNNKGDAVSVFQQAWNRPDEAVAVLQEGAQGAQIVGICSMVCASIVLALKINVIVQLTILAIQIAQAIATAVVTFGASLAQIPIFKIITQKLLDILIDQAIGMLLNG